MIESQHVPAENIRPHQRHFQKLSIGRDHLRPNEGTLGNWLPHVESIHLEVSWEIVVTGKWIFSNEHLSNSNTTRAQPQRYLTLSGANSVWRSCLR